MDHPPADTLQLWSSRLAASAFPASTIRTFRLSSTTSITERLDLIFRTDFINAFNSPQFFSGPVTTVTSGNFGRISGAMDQSNLPRFIQLSMKLNF